MRRPDPFDGANPLRVLALALVAAGCGGLPGDVPGLDGADEGELGSTSQPSLIIQNPFPYAPRTAWTERAYFGLRGTFFADVTGDKKADAIAVNDWGVAVRRSDGAEFLPDETWSSTPYFGGLATFFADVTGDKKAEAIVVNDWGVTVRRSDGTKFLAGETWTGTPYFGGLGTFFADVTGDGKADAIAVNDWGV